jgi:hypothetical protein
MKSIIYYDLTNFEKKAFYSFLEEASKETAMPAHVNMKVEDYSNQPNTLLYILEKTDRFSKNGLFQILFDNNEVVACSGAYTSDFCPELAILGVRTWTPKKFRNQFISREFLLPVERKWAIETGHKAIAITFNEYNKNLSKLWSRKGLGLDRSARQEYHFGFNGVNFVEFPVTIQYTKQYIIYEKIDDSWIFDWSEIRSV